MRRLLITLLVAGCMAGAGASAASAAAPSVLPSYTEPNATGSIVVPLALSSPPRIPEQRSYAQLLQLWQEAGAAYGVPWPILASINKIESNFGRNMGPSSAGALGWMQFMPETWMRWGMDANGDGIASPWTPEDGVYSAARYLAAAGAHEDLSRAIFAYNHAQWYVDDVLELARLFAGDPGAFAAEHALPLFAPGAPSGPQLVFRIDDIEQRIAKARKRVTRARTAIDRAQERVEEARWATLDARQRAGDPELSDTQFAELEQEATQAALAEEQAAAEVDRRYQELDYAVTRLDELKKQAEVQVSAVTFSRPLGTLGGSTVPVLAPGAIGDYVFPVGGGPGSVSVARDHHDYPAADIAAPEGSPVYALANAIVLDTFPDPTGRCGIGLKLRVEDGHEYVYCHLAYLEPTLTAGVALPAGAPVGLVGSTGRSTGPHLHLQFSPAVAYPQEEPWFQAFAGRFFRWQGEAVAGATASSGRVFDVVAEPVVTFTR